jgi:hypothetical protein
MLAGFMRWSDLFISRAEAVEARGAAAQADAARFQAEAQLAEAEAVRVLLQVELEATRGASQLHAEAVRAQLQAELRVSRDQLQAVTVQLEEARSEAATAAAQSAAALAASERRAADLEAEVERLRAAAVRDRLPPDFSCGKTLQLPYLMTRDLRCSSFVAGWWRRSRGGCSGI